MEDHARRIEALVLVFDAEAGALNALIDSTKKLFRINGCSLCSITHGLMGEKAEWRSCRDTLGIPVEYVHRDELDAELRETVGKSLPCVLARTAKGTELLMGPEVLKRCGGSVADFRGRLLHHAARLRLSLD